MAEIGAAVTALWGSLTAGGAAGAAGAAGAGAATGTGIGTTLLQGAAIGAAGAGVGKLLAPKAPKAPGAAPLPDQAAVDAARRRSLASQLRRRGRDSTILSQDDGGTLG